MMCLNRSISQFIAMATLLGAIGWVSVAHAQTPEDYQAAAMALEHGHLEQACKQYQALHKANPTDPNALYGLAVCARSHNDIGKATRILKGIFSSSPTFAPAQLLMGELLDEQGQPSAANTHYQTYAKLAKQQGIPLPKDPTIRLRLRGLGG